MLKMLTMNCNMPTLNAANDKSILCSRNFQISCYADIRLTNVDAVLAIKQSTKNTFFEWLVECL